MQTSNEVEPAQLLRTDKYSIIERRRVVVCLHAFHPNKRRAVYVNLRTEKESGATPEYSATVESELDAEERTEMYLCIKSLVRGNKCFMAIKLPEPEII